MPKVYIRDLSGTRQGARHPQTPYLVVYYFDRKARSRYFPNRDAAEKCKAETEKTLARALDPTELQGIRRVIAGTGYDAVTVAEAGVAALRAKGIRGSGTALFKKGTELVIEKAEERGDKPSTIAAYTAAYSVINSKFGSRIAASITDNEVKEYLRKLKNRKGEVGHGSRRTRKGILRLIRMALRELGFDRPLATIVTPKDQNHEIEFFTNDEVRMMLAATPPWERGAVAMAIVGGFRPELLSRMSVASVDMVNRRIHIPAYLAKDGRAHVLEVEVLLGGRHIPGLPEQLFVWLEKFPYAPTNWKLLQRRLARIIGRWIHDGTRHTAATNYFPLNGRENTGRFLTHAGDALVFEHYVGVTTRDAAKDFQGILPDTVAFLPHRQRCEREKLPCPSQVAKELKREPACLVAKRYDVAVSTLHRYCKKHGIEKAGPGDWTRRRWSEQQALLAAVHAKLPADWSFLPHAMRPSPPSSETMHGLGLNSSQS